MPKSRMPDAHKAEEQAVERMEEMAVTRRWTGPQMMGAPKDQNNRRIVHAASKVQGKGPMLMESFGPLNDGATVPVYFWALENKTRHPWCSQEWCQSESGGPSKQIDSSP